MVKEMPAWFRDIPPTVVAIDTETTGVRQWDRVISFAGIRFHTAALLEHRYQIEVTNLVFDPGRYSDPEAERVHGLDDWFLRHQNPISTHLDQIQEFVASADLVIGHNIAFDADFLDREFSLNRQSLTLPKLFCTMGAYEEFNPRGKKTLTAACRYFGVKRQGKRHGALEDAWLAFQVFLGMRWSPLPPIGMPESLRLPFHNERQAPTRPPGQLPPRQVARSKSKRAHSLGESGDR